jgi:ATP-dependent DNA helicase RecQ
MSPEDRTSWESAGKLFNRSLGYDGDSSVDELLAGYTVQALPLHIDQPTLPIARLIQEETLSAIEGLLADESKGLCIALVQPPGMCTLTALHVLLSRFRSGTGKTWYYLSLCAKFRCVVVVVVPLKPLLEEAVANARRLCFRTFEMKTLLTLSPDELWDRTSGSCLIFVSLDALSSAQSVLALGKPCIVVVDEAHMVKLDIHYRPNLRSGWELGARNVSEFPWILLTATLRPSMENDVIYNLGLEDASNLHVLRTTVDRGPEYSVTVEWYAQKNDALEWLRRTEPTIIFVMSRGQAEQLGRDLGLIFIHSGCEDGDRRRKIDAVSRGELRCVATSSIGVGVNMAPKHVVIFDFTCVQV